MDDELAVDEEGEDALYEYLFGQEAAVAMTLWRENGHRLTLDDGTLRHARTSRKRRVPSGPS